MQQGAGRLLEKQGRGLGGGLHDGRPEGHQARQGDEAIGEGGAQEGREIKPRPDPPARAQAAHRQGQGESFDRNVEKRMVPSPPPKQRAPEPTPRKPHQEHTQLLTVRIGVTRPDQCQQQEWNRAQG